MFLYYQLLLRGHGVFFSQRCIFMHVTSFVQSNEFSYLHCNLLFQGRFVVV